MKAKNIWTQFSSLPLIYLLLWSAIFATSLVLNFYFESPINQILSYGAHDLPSNAGDIDVSSANFGVHFFGDFMLPFEWSLYTNPWIEYQATVVSYPPVPIYLLKLLHPFSYMTGLLIYLSTLIALSFGCLMYLLRGLEVYTRTVFTIFCGLLSGPFLVALDRGNNVAFLLPLMAGFIIAFTKKKKKWTIALLAIMVSIKVYPIFFIILLLKFRWFKESIQTLLAVLFLNFALVLATPGPIDATIKSIWNGIAGFSSQPLLGMGYQNTSLIGSLENLFFNQNIMIDGTILFSIQLMCACVLLVSIFLADKRNVWLIVLLCGLLMYVFAPILYAYFWVWLVPVLALAIRDEVIAEEDKHFHESSTIILVKKLIILANLMVLLPWIFELPFGSTIPQIGLRSSLIVLVVFASFLTTTVGVLVIALYSSKGNKPLSVAPK